MRMSGGVWWSPESMFFVLLLMLLLIVNANPPEALLTASTRFWRPCVLLDSAAISSAKSRSDSLLLSDQVMPWPLVAFFRTQSIATAKRIGERMQPWRTPVSTWNQSMKPPSVRTQQREFSLCVLLLWPPFLAFHKRGELSTRKVFGCCQMPR